MRNEKRIIKKIYNARIKKKKMKKENVKKLRRKCKKENVKKNWEENEKRIIKKLKKLWLRKIDLF